MWVSTVTKEELEKLYQEEQDRLISYIQKAYKARVKWVKQGRYDQAITSEIGVCLSTGRLDLVANLIGRQKTLESLKAQLESLEYQERFAEPDIKLPNDEPVSTTENTSDSTQI